MNLVGKIFTVLICVMSLVFMAFAVAVYATHRNWKEVVVLPEEQVRPGHPLGLEHVKKKLEARNQELRDQKAELEAEVEAERKARDQAVAKLETENDKLKNDFTQLQQQYAQLVQERRDAVAALNAIQMTLGAMRTEIATLRAGITQAEGDRDNHFKEIVRLTDQVHQLVNERQRLLERQLTLSQDLGKAEKVLRHFGYTKDTSLDANPPSVDGIVTAVPQPDLCEISLGSDDGLMKGHKLEVYRQMGGANNYVGRIYVMSTTFDKAACKVDPQYLKSPIQRGDRVTSRLVSK